MKFMNKTADRVVVPELGIDCEPHGICDVPEAYAWPTRATNGSRSASGIELRAPQLVPLDADLHKEWLEVPSESGPKKVVASGKSAAVENEPIPAGVSPGVAEVLAKKKAAQRKESVATDKKE